MTKRLSNEQIVINLQNRINAICGYGTIVHINYNSDFREIVLTGDGLLALKGIMSADGKRVKITKCPTYMNRFGKVTDKHESIQHANRWPFICDEFTHPPISFQKLAAICIKYKKAWSHTP